MAKKRADIRDRLLAKIDGMNLGSGGSFWKPEEGRNTIRILPAVDTMEFWFKEVGRHFKQNQYCPRISSEGEKACPICELNEQLFSSDEKELAKDYRAGRAFWMNIIDRKNPDAGPQIYTPGVLVFTGIAAFVQDPEYGDITDLDKGLDVKINRKGTGRDNTEYTVLSALNHSPLSDDEEEIDKWMEAVIDLDARIAGMLLDEDELIKKAGLQAYFDDEEPLQDVNEENEEPASTKISRRVQQQQRKRRR